MNHSIHLISFIADPVANFGPQIAQLPITLEEKNGYVLAIKPIQKVTKSSIQVKTWIVFLQ